MAEKRVIDWEGVERDYRAGLLSLREISDKYKKSGSPVSHVSIKHKAEKEGWVRDTRAKIQQRAQELVNKAEANSLPNAEAALLSKATENQVVQVNAIKAADIQISQRRDITRMRNLVIKLLEECEAEASDPAVFYELGILLRSEDRNGQDKLNDAYHKAISLPSRIKGVKDLADALKTLISLEREAYGLAAFVDPDAAKPGQPVDQTEAVRRLAFVFTQAAQPQGASHAGTQIH